MGGGRSGSGVAAKTDMGDISGPETYGAQKAPVRAGGMIPLAKREDSELDYKSSLMRDGYSERRLDLKQLHNRVEYGKPKHNDRRRAPSDRGSQGQPKSKSLTS